MKEVWVVLDSNNDLVGVYSNESRANRECEDTNRNRTSSKWTVKKYPVKE